MKVHKLQIKKHKVQHLWNRCSANPILNFFLHFFPFFYISHICISPWLIGMLFCERVNVNIKEYSKAYFSHIIQIFPNRSIHYGKIFFDKIIRGKIFSNTILHGKILYDKNEYYEACFSNNELICHVDTRQ